MTQINKTDLEYGYIYLIREREFVNSDEHVYKIGATVQKSPSLTLSRFNGYKKQSQLLCTCICDAVIVFDIETDLKRIFKYTFEKHSDGYEYFIGDPNKMLKIIYETVGEYNLINEFSDKSIDECEEVSECNNIINSIQNTNGNNRIPDYQIETQRQLFMYIYNFSNKTNRKVMKSQLSKYLANETTINRSYSISHGFNKEMTDIYEKYTKIGEEFRRKTIIQIFNIMTCQKYDNCIPLQSVGVFKLPPGLCRNRIKRVITNVEYFKNPHKYHQLFFESRKRNRASSKTVKRSSVTASDVWTVKNLLKYYGIIFKTYKKVMIKGATFHHYKIYVPKEIRKYKFPSNMEKILETI